MIPIGLIFIDSIFSIIITIISLAIQKIVDEHSSVA
jgi:uncharacterized membrane protein